MADAFPSIILDNVLEQLGLPIFQSNKLNCFQRIQVRDLRSKLELIRSVIDDAEQMAVLFPDVVGKWVRDLQRVLYEIDDLLDEVVTRSMPSSGVLKKVHLRLYCLPFDLTVAPKVKRFNKRLENIVNECRKCNLLVQPAHSRSNVASGVEKPVARKGIPCYHPDCTKDGGEFHMIGRDDDKKKVIDLLFDEDADEPCFLIWGKVGVGKTTLCHAIYNDEKVGNHFASRLWVDFVGVNDSEEEQTQLRHKIDSSIEKKAKTLIVLDNLLPPTVSTCTISGYWSDLRDSIATSHKGSKILLNSSLRPMSGEIDSKCQHELKNDLCEEHCRSIFEKAASAPGHDREEWMTDLGKEIADKCPGNPALLRAVGTLLYQNDDKALWDYFAHDFDFNRQYHHYCEISRIFQLLPKGQQVVGYLKLFTKNDFKYEALFDQYAAHGFFTNSSATIPHRLRVELFWPREKEDHWDDDGAPNYGIAEWSENIITLLAGSEAVFLGLRMEIGVGKEARHVAIDRPSSSAARHRDIVQLPRSLTNDAVHKRTLLFSKELTPVRLSVETLNMLTSKLLHLRVLDLHDLALKALPSSFGKLIHLRYLDLSRNEFRELPKSICRLKNLRTLKLTYCDKLVKLPQSIKSLRFLKHLELGMCLDLTGMPSAMAEMTSLETLDRFIVSPRNGGLRYLKNLNKLRGSLSIELPRQWKGSTEEAGQANLKSKHGLTSVKFKWSGAYKHGDGNHNYDVLDKLFIEPCTKIEDLSFINFGGEAFPNWVTSLGMENHLATIAISHCRGCRILPPFHKMPKLCHLTLTSMDIEYIQDDNNNNRGDASADTVFFPSLFTLRIGIMPKLIGWSRDMSGLLRFPSCIYRVEIWDCPRLTVMPPISTSNIVLQDISKMMLQRIDCRASGSLHILSIRDMVSLPNEFVTMLPAELEVEDCDKWQVFWANETECTSTWRSLSEGFQHLTHLTIKNCPAMKYLSSSLRHLINLQHLKISRCSEDLDCLYDEDEDGMPWKALQSLRRLKIRGFDKLETLPKALLQHLPPLSELAIMDCKSLKSCFHFSEWNEAKVCPIEEIGKPKMLSGVFRSLTRLRIANCPEIKHLSGSLEHLVMLERLGISKCSEELDCLYKEKDDGMPWKALQKLRFLKIEGFENLAVLPKGLQHLDQLEELGIRDCKNLKGGLDSLPRLKNTLYIESCPHFSKEPTRKHPDLRVVEGKLHMWSFLKQ